MKARKRSSSANSRARTGSFIRTVFLSALTTFAVALYAWVPEWRYEIPVEQWIDELSELVSTSTRQPSVASNAVFVHETAGNAVLQTRFVDCPQFFVAGKLPQVPVSADLRELCYTSFAILHSGVTKTPVFVAQRLNRNMLQQAQKISRNDRFYEEARLPTRERAQLSDYRGSGYSRGHMAPAADMDNEQAMAQSFSLANMVPQDQRHNGGAWAQIEQDTRKYVARAQGDVYILTGPVYETAPSVIGTGKVAIPTYLYKVVYDPSTKRAWVHWHANHPETRASRPITYDEFVRRTGMHLLPEGAVQ